MYLVFDVGGTFIKYAFMDQKGKIYEKYKVPTPFQDGKVDDNGDEITPYTVKTEDGIAAFLEQIDIIYGKYSKEYQITGIAMSLPGQVNVNQGIVYGGGSLPYLDRVPLGNLISRRCGNVPVALENDAKCAALAEVWIGNAKDCKDACVLVFGTGIGGGIIIDRKVRHGVGMIAGEMSFCMTDFRLRMWTRSVRSKKSIQSKGENYRILVYGRSRHLCRRFAGRLLRQKVSSGRK